MQRKLVRFVLASAVFLITLVGCGAGSKKTVKLKGKVVLPANAHLETNDTIYLNFIPQGGEKMAAATADVKVPELTFAVNSAAMTGVIPGQYKIAVQIQPYPGTERDPKKAGIPALNQALTAETTKLTYEIPATPAEQSMTIDLTKGTVTKD
ncbi:MAG: hypothetical protein U0736_01360 [Gemmataceae bacterium]